MSVAQADWPELLALLPRLGGERSGAPAIAALLEAERVGVVALAVRAIATAWDEGRLARDDAALPLERTVLGLAGAVRGLASERLREADASLAVAAVESRGLATQLRGQRTPLDELIDEFALTPLSRMVLVVVAAPHLWGEVAQLYAILAGGPSRATVDEHLVRTLLGPGLSPLELASVLDAQAPLLRFGLLQEASANPRPFTALRPHPFVLARLRGGALDEDPEEMLDVAATSPPLESLRLAPAVAHGLRRSLARVGPRPVRLVVRGRPGSGRRTLLAALAARARRRLALIRIPHLRLGQHDPPTAADLDAALRRCAIAGWLPCLDGLDQIAEEDRALRDKLRHVIDRFPGPVLVRALVEEQPPLAPGYVQIDLPTLTETERVDVWAESLAAQGIAAPTLVDVAARWQVGAGTIHRVVADVVAAAPPGEVPTRATIDAAVSQHIAARLGNVAERVTRLPRLADVILPADIHDSLVEFQARLRYHRRVFEDWGLGARATTGRGLAALLQGAPGTGKTMVAGALARELGLELYRVDLSRIMSKWIGETEANLSRVFAAAEESQAILLFDEADSLFAKRTEVKSSNDRFANLEVNYLLQRLDSFGGVVVLTTNFGTAIDPAFRRRLSFRITFPVPDEELREQLWRAHLPPSLPVADDLDLAELARKFALTGGSVKNCVTRAAFLAAAEDTVLSQAHLRRAITIEYRAGGKLSEGGVIE